MTGNSIGPGLIISLLIASLIVIAVLAYRNYQLQRRTRCMIYCWQAMSSFAHKKVYENEEGFDHQWRNLLTEHWSFMAKFGIERPEPDDMGDFEASLKGRGVAPLREHV